MPTSLSQIYKNYKNNKLLNKMSKSVYNYLKPTLHKYMDWNLNTFDIDKLDKEFPKIKNYIKKTFNIELKNTDDRIWLEIIDYIFRQGL